MHGLQKDIYARFGSAIANIGDIDGNEFNDVAVGAPLEADNAGSVYIYNGFNDGLKKKFSQVGYTALTSLNFFLKCFVVLQPEIEMEILGFLLFDLHSI